MSAVIDGLQWSATSNIVPIYMNPALSVAGESTDRRTVGLGLSATTTGTYSTGNSPFVEFTIFEVAPGATAAAAWITRSGLPGTSGTVTLTTLTSSTAAGTFSFTAAPLAGTPATGTKTVSNGVFNVRF